MHTSTASELYWIGLNCIPGIGRVSFRKLVQHFGSPEGALSASPEMLAAVGGLSDKAIEGITSYAWRENAEQELKKAREAGVTVLTAESQAYPASLRNTPDHPAFLYIKGSLGQADGIAIVGTRKPTHYGLTITHRIAFELASAGFTIVSGLARGIDTQAHKGALAAKGKTIAVLACGIDVAYPPENKALLQQIAQNGAVVSENAFGTKPEAGYFPARNRIISGLSVGTVIIEAAEDSGSLITADYAIEQGRKLFAVPGNIGSPNSKGTNSLIKRGAVLVEDAADVLRGLGIQKPELKREQAAGQPPPGLSPDEKKVLGCITNEPRHIDSIMNESGLSAGRVSGILIGLELKGLAKQLTGKYYVRAES